MKRIFAMLLCFSMSFSTLNASTIFVDLNAIFGLNDGTSWADAYIDLQDAIDVALAGDQIWIAQGTYLPTVALGTDPRSRTFYITLDGIEIYGGFDGLSTNFADRDWVLYPTILSGDFNGDDTATGVAGTASFAMTNNTENAYHVVYIDGQLFTGSIITSATLLDGVQVSGGFANGPSYLDIRGAGLLNNGQYGGNASPTISNCIFAQNSASTFGGGVLNHAQSGVSSPTFTNCTFTQNDGGSKGGGVHNAGWGGSGPGFEGVSSPIFTDCTFSQNKASNGGAVMNDAFSGGGTSAPIFTSCIFSQNIGQGSGCNNAGFEGSSDPIFTNCAFSQNTGTLVRNSSSSNAFNASADPMFTNCTFSQATGTLVQNSSSSNGVLTSTCNPTITNCIVWGTGSNLITNGGNATGTMSYSIYGDGTIDGTVTLPTGMTDGGNNLDADPLFTDAANGDLTLNASSPAIDAGNNAANTTLTAIDGSARIQNVIDMGAYEQVGLTGLVQHPMSQTACNGSNITFSVAAAGTGLTYQWYMQNGAGFLALTDNATFSGTNTATLMINNVSGGYDNRNFHCVVSGSFGTATSNNALLTVVNSTANIVLTSPTNQSVCEGTTTGFAVTVNSTGVTYQWQADLGAGFVNIADGTNYTGTNTANLSVLTPALAADGTLFQCVVTIGTCGNLTATPATLTVLPNSSITSQPTNVGGLCPGDNTSFTVASNSSSSTYQWQINLGSGFLNMSNSATYTGVNTPTLLLSNVSTGMNSYQYRCMIGNICPPILISNAVSLTVNTSPLTIDALATYTVMLDPSETASISLGDLLNTPITHPCGITAQSIVSGPSNFDCVSVGSTYPVTISATAGNSQTASATVMVSVTDPNSYCCAAPQVFCNSTIPLTLIGSTVTLNPNVVMASNIAPCGIQSISLSQTTFDCSHIGNPTTVTYTLTDNQSQTTTCSSTVIVTDGGSPSAMCVAPFDVYLDATGNAQINTAMINNGSSDNCTSTGDLVVAISKTDFDCSDIGTTYPITLTVEDVAGHSSSCTTMVTVLGNPSEVVSTRTLSITDAILVEGTSDTTMLDFVVSLSGHVVCTPVMVDYATSDSTTIAGMDYLTQSGTLTFAQGETSKIISIGIIGDLDIEAAQEEFKLHLSNPQAASFGDSLAIGRILDDEALPTLSVDSVSVNEGDASATFTISLSTASTLPISVEIITSNQTALAGIDYTHMEDTLHFAAGDTSATFSVLLLEDINFDDTTMFIVTLNTPINALIADPIGSATISDNEVPQCLDLVVSTTNEGESAANGLNYSTLTIDATINGNTGLFTYEWDTEGYVQFNIIEDGFVSVLHANDAMWSITVTDASGNCSGVVTNELIGGTVDVDVLTVDDVNTISSNCNNQNGSISLSVIGGSGDYEFVWSNNFVDTDADGDGKSTITALAKGWYFVIVTDVVTGESVTEWIWMSCTTNQGGIRGKNQISILNASIGPNPFKESTNILINSTIDQTITVNVLNMNGQLIEELYQDFAWANSSIYLTFNSASKLPTGIYVLQIINENGGIQTEKLLLQR